VIRFDVQCPLDDWELAMQEANSSAQKREDRTFDTKSVWEQFLNEIVETRRELSARLDRIEAIVLETRSGLRDVKGRLDKIEWDREPIQ
jgi:hypothetical protein